jgi:uncharacterized protein (DUF1697 family)
MARPVCVFMRGVNIGETRIGMQALGEAFEAMGFSGVQTRLSTGNVIGWPPAGVRTNDGLRAMVKAGLRERFGYRAYVIIRDELDLADILVAAQMMRVPEDYQQYMLLCDEGDTIADLTRLYENTPHAPFEQWLPHAQGAFWVMPRGEALKTPFWRYGAGGSAHQGEGGVARHEHHPTGI